MSRLQPPRRRGVAGVLFMVCVAFGAAGAGFDLLTNARPTFWIGDYPGAAAAIGAGAALLALLVGHAARVLARRDAMRDGKGGRNARGHP